MNTHPALDKAQAYLNVQIGAPSPATIPRPGGPFITISRESGSGGSSLARTLADRLNQERTGEASWYVYDGNLIDSMLETNHLEPRLAQFLPEDSVSEINASVGELVGLHPNIWELVRKTNEMMRLLATTGYAIIVGRGANFATADIQSGVHVRLTAEPEQRAHLMARARQVDLTTAREINERQDAARERYVRANFNTDIRDPRAYDLVINTGRVPLTHAAELIASIVQIRAPLRA
jgi:cytidylate kinase